MTPEQIKLRIEKEIPGATAYVYMIDPTNDEGLLQAFVISPDFEGMPPLKQRQMVMAAVKDIHQIAQTLSLKTFPPSKWREVKFQPPVSGKRRIAKGHLPRLRLLP